MAAVLHDVGGEIAASRKLPAAATLDERLKHMLKLLEEFGGHAHTERTNGTIIIRSANCPLAEVTADHPEVCQMLETLCSKTIGKPVASVVNAMEEPKCVFEVKVGAR